MAQTCSNYVHIVPSDSSAGALKFAMPKKTEIAFISLDLETGSLPDDLSKESYLECKQSEYWNVGDGWSYKIFGAYLSRYDGIIVWHSKDVRINCVWFGLYICPYKPKPIY